MAEIQKQRNMYEKKKKSKKLKDKRFTQSWSFTLQTKQRYFPAANWGQKRAPVWNHEMAWKGRNFDRLFPNLKHNHSIMESLKGNTGYIFEKWTLNHTPCLYCLLFSRLILVFTFVKFLSILLFFFLFCIFRTTLAAYGSSQARGQIGAAAASLHHSYGYTGSLTHWVRPGIKPVSSWILVRFITTKPWWELQEIQSILN